MSTSALTTARRYRAAGFSLLPVKADGSKAPDVPTWKPYQSRQPTDEELAAWFGNGTARGFALVHGKVSGNSEVLDFDAPGLFEEYETLCAQQGLGDLLQSLPVVETPSGGHHLYYRCEAAVEGNQKLARSEQGEVKVETRGESGYTVAPGSPAACHEANLPYRRVRGDFKNIPVITPAERAELLDIARVFDDYAAVTEARIHPEPRTAHPTAGINVRPGDDFNERGDPLPLLEGAGWQMVGTRGDTVLLRRPGKGKGISATWNHRGHRLLYVFTSNGLPFEADTAYRPFSVFALLNCEGDFAEAARQLGQEGYGDPLPPVGPAAEPKTVLISSPRVQQRPWPKPPDKAAYYGLAGEIVRAIEPHTEADPVALLGQLLVGFGNLIGRSAFYQVEGDRHYGNLFLCLVGSSSTGRKGTSWGHMRNVLAEVDPEWITERVKSGLSSGEGMIHAVRDDREAGDEDKRLLVYESELASVLRVMEREGNTISARIRDAWDTGDLATLTRNDPQKATGAHISIIGHITPGELLRYLRATETANGFANRFQWLCVRRSKCLPDGGSLDEAVIAPLVARLAKAAEFARNCGQVRRDEEARELWHAIYPTLTAEVPGLLGAITSRAAPQVTRLSLVYALLDHSPVIRAEHLEAAVALWEYLKDSSRYIFGDALGDPVADTILKALRDKGAGGCTLTELHQLFKRNQSADRIAQALDLLQSAGLARREKHTTTGRAAEVWYAT